ncbi:MAG: terminase large subunit [Sedimentisphaerales bacterium]|nr:terminase large subunit [Sedimentisphaerales bacterium]
MENYPDYIFKIPNYDPVATNTDDYYFDEDRANHVIGFIESLKFIEGSKAGQPFVLEPWQKAIVGNIFGWVNESGMRRFKKIFIEIPRKSGKSMLLSAIMLYICCCEVEAAAQNYSVAADRDQATIIYNNISRMIDNSSILRKITKKYKSYKKIEFRRNDTVFKSLSSDNKGKHGLNIHALIIDELHCITDRELIDALITSQGARSNPIIMYITTAGIYDPESICYKEYEYACNVRDGVFEDERYLPVIYEADSSCRDNADYPCSEGCTYTEETFWQCPKIIERANPNLGVSVPMSFFLDELKRAMSSPEKEAAFKRLYLNIWVQSHSAWLNMDKWQKCGKHELLTAEEELELDWYGGLDLSKCHDLSTLVLVALKDNVVYAKCFVWMPKSAAIRKQESDRVPYLTWAKAGIITLTDKEITDYQFIQDSILALSKQYKIKEIAVDSWESEHMIQQLADEGLDIFPFSQGIKSISHPSKKFEESIIEERFCHGNNPIMRWCANNVQVYKDPNENIKPVKESPHSSKRIDCIISSIMACARLIENEYVEEEFIGDILFM